MVQTELHIVESSTHLIDQGQVQNSATNESSEQNDHTDICSEVRALFRVSDQEVKNRNDQHDLAQEAQQHMQEYIQAFSFPNLKLLNLLLHRFLLSHHIFISISVQIFFL